VTEDVTILFCPKCGQRYKERKKTFNLMKPLTCSACRKSFGVNELVTGSGEKLPEYTANQEFPGKDTDPTPRVH